MFLHRKMRQIRQSRCCCKRISYNSPAVAGLVTI